MTAVQTLKPWLAAGAAGVLLMAWLAGPVAAAGQEQTNPGQTVKKGGEQTAPKAKPRAMRARMAPPEDELEKDTKFKSRQLQPAPSLAPGAAGAPARPPGGSRIGGQTIRGKESPD
jgi:hypothetical protein